MIIDGKKIAEDIQEELKVVVSTCINAGKKRPKLVAILVGNHPSSKAYIGRKMQAAKAIGSSFLSYFSFKRFHHQSCILILTFACYSLYRNRELHHPSGRKHIASRVAQGDRHPEQGPIGRWSPSAITIAEGDEREGSVPSDSP